MYRCTLLQLVVVATGIGQNCIPYGARTTINGSLFIVDESGYKQYIAVRLQRPICTVPGSPKDAEWAHSESGLRVIQAGVYGSDEASEKQRDRLDRLVGHEVVLKGYLSPRVTGYDRTAVHMYVEAVGPVDSSGRNAVQTPVPPFKPKAVEVYDVTVSAGTRLVVEARQTKSGTLLTPGEKYSRHWMTGGEVLYVDCMKGYDRALISTTEKDGGTCPDRDLCGLTA